jgi:hypothetical protein
MLNRTRTLRLAVALFALLLAGAALTTGLTHHGVHTTATTPIVVVGQD